MSRLFFLSVISSLFVAPLFSQGSSVGTATALAVKQEKGSGGSPATKELLSGLDGFSVGRLADERSPAYSSLSSLSAGGNPFVRV